MPKPMIATRALLVVALLALAACGAKGNPHPSRPDPYVALGDSYTALAGVGPFTDAACNRSVGNYPNLIAKDLEISNFTDASCGGATSAALTQDQTILNSGVSRPPQLAALSKKTKLVTIGIGLNNNQIAYYLLYVCTPINGITLPNCSTYLNLPESTVSLYVRTMLGQVKQNLEDVRKAAPNARIILVGYPRILADGTDCPSRLPLPAVAADRLRSVLKTVDQQYAELAEKQKIDYVDMWSAKGHDVCSSDPWMAGEVNVPGKARQFHPYETYHRAVADKIVALLKK